MKALNLPFFVMVFYATEDTIRTEKFLKDYFKVAIMPTPREISESCGFAIRFFDASENELKRIVEKVDCSWTLYHLGAKVKGEERTVRVVAENGRMKK